IAHRLESLWQYPGGSGSAEELVDDGHGACISLALLSARGRSRTPREKHVGEHTCELIVLVPGHQAQVGLDRQGGAVLHIADGLPESPIECLVTGLHELLQSLGWMRPRSSASPISSARRRSGRRVASRGAAANCDSCASTQAVAISAPRAVPASWRSGRFKRSSMRTEASSIGLWSGVLSRPRPLPRL